MQLREYIQKLDEMGDLKVVDQEVSWNLEAPAISVMCDRLGGPRLIFSNIKGCPNTRLMGNPLTTPLERPWRRHAIAMGMDPDVSWDEFYDDLDRRARNLIKPTIVSTGPCKENILLGKDADLFKLPWPYLHDGDGGRYGSLGSLVSKDTVLDWTNYGNYRLQIQTKNKATPYVHPEQHFGYHYFRRYEAEGKTMPVAYVVGGEMGIMAVGAWFVPFGINEMEVAGGFEDEPIQLVRCETSDLLVPANAEIIIEGEMRPHERMDEGPFGEYTGFVHGPRWPEPVIRVTAITHRNNPIIPFAVEGMPESGNQVGTMAAFYPVMATAGIRDSGFPIDYFWWNAYWMPTFSTKVPHQTFIQDLLNFYEGFDLRGYLRANLVCDEAGIWDYEGMLEHLFLKAHPSKFRITDPDLHHPKVQVYLSPPDRERQLGASVQIDATWPLDWKPEERPQKVTFNNSFPKETQDWVAQNWKRLGLPGEPKAK